MHFFSPPVSILGTRCKTVLFPKLADAFLMMYQTAAVGIFTNIGAFGGFCHGNPVSLERVQSDNFGIEKARKRRIRKLYGQTFFLFRLRSKFNTEIDALPLGSHLITMYGDLSLRIVKFELPSGEIETLLTNLFDIEESEFKELYFKRWPVEVKFDIVKNKLELPIAIQKKYKAVDKGDKIEA